MSSELSVTQVETMIVSDVHLGSEISRACDLLGVLQTYRFKRLILLGDIFCDLNFKRLTGDHKVTRLKESETRIIISMTFCTDPRASRLKTAMRRIKDTAYFGARALWS